MSFLERQLEASTSLAGQNRAAKGLRDAWARVQRAESAFDVHGRHGSAPAAERELHQSRADFADMAAIALGLTESRELEKRTTISDEDSK